VVAETIIIEFIGDASKLEPAVNVLESLGKIDAKSVEAFKKANAELAKKTEITKKTTEANKAQLKSFEDIRRGADKMADAFQQGFSEGVVDALNEAGVSVEQFASKLKKASEESLKKKLRDIVGKGKCLVMIFMIWEMDKNATEIWCI